MVFQPYGTQVLAKLAGDLLERACALVMRDRMNSVVTIATDGRTRRKPMLHYASLDEGLEAGMPISAHIPVHRALAALFAAHIAAAPQAGFLSGGS